ncbi:MAG: YdcF family protein [archaeon]|nr:MAG: YdcF family protein [archaeon]
MANLRATVIGHGFNFTPTPGLRNPKDVVYDRVREACRAVDLFYKGGYEVDFMISGGTETDGVKEADNIEKIVQKYFSDVYKKANVVKEKESLNTMENVLKTYDFARDVGTDILCPVSSMDHVRVPREWAYERKPGDPLLAFIPSQEPYSKKGWKIKPFITEPPYWANDFLPGVFKVKADKRGKFQKGFESLVKDCSQD